jgi:pentatricopeptide repeat protein
VSYNIVLKGLLTAERWEDAEDLMAEVAQKGCPPNVVTFNMLISFLCRRGLVEPAMEVLEQIPK